MSKKNIRILQVLDNYYPIVDGPVCLITNYAKCMNEKAQCEVLVPFYPKYVDNQPFKVNRIMSMQVKKTIPRLPLPLLDPKTRKFFKENEFDIIHTHSPVTLGRYAAKYAKKHNIPVCFTMHTKFHEEINRSVRLKFIQKFMLKFIMQTINKMDYVMAVSDGAGDCLRNYGYKGNIDIVRNGTDLTFPTTDISKQVTEISAEYKLDEVENIFLFVGRIVIVKKIQSLLRIMVLLKERGVSFKMLIVGDGDYLDDLKKQADELNVNDVVIFTGKVLDRNKLSAFYLRSDLFLFPSTFDTASLVPLEAAALKLPSLLVKGCSSAEIITNDVNGYLAEESDITWANRIEEIVNDKDKLHKVKEACYKDVYKSWDAVTDEVLDMYEKYIEDYKKASKDKK